MQMLSVLLVVCLVAGETWAANILALLPLDIASHHHVFEPILRELAARGHQVTVVTPIEDKNPPPGYKQILVPKMKISDVRKDVLEENELFKAEPVTLYSNQMQLWNCTLRLTEFVIASNEFQQFIKNDATKYDLVIYEAFYQEAFLVYASKYNAPIVAISTFGSAHFINQQMGNPYELSYAAHEFMELTGKLDFMSRLRNAFWTMVDLYERTNYLVFEHEELVKKNSENLPLKLKSISLIEKDVSLALVNSHFSIDGVRANVPGVVEIGGVHIKEPKALPEDVQKFMDGAEDGVVYFSLGSTIKCSEIPKDYLKIFLNVFAGLKQRLIWKWDDDSLPGKSDNVMISKWLPQADILAHPKMKLFINQGGALSIQEAISRAVPVVCLPLYGDQFKQCAQVKNLAFGEDVVVHNITEESFRDTIRKVLKDTGYKESAKKLRVLFNDRPMTALETAVYWIEYVIRHKGASHLSSPSRNMGWWEYNMVDVSFLIGFSVFSFFWILNWMFWNVALRKKIQRDDLKELIAQHQPRKAKTN